MTSHYIFRCFVETVRNSPIPSLEIKSDLEDIIKLDHQWGDKLPLNYTTISVQYINGDILTVIRLDLNSFYVQEHWSNRKKLDKQLDYDMNQVVKTIKEFGEIRLFNVLESFK